MTPAAEGGVSGAAWVEEVTREFRATMTYISRFGFHADDGIDVIIVCDDISRQFFTAADLGVKRLRCITVSDALRMINAKSFGLEKTNFADGLHAAWVAKKRALRLPIRVPSLHKVMAPRLIAQGLAVGMVFSALAMTYLSFSAVQENFVLSQEIDQRLSQKSLLERELEDEKKVFDTLPVKVDLLKGTLAVRDLIEKNSAGVPEILSQLKAALSDVTIKSLEFDHETSPQLKLSAGKQGAGGYAPPPMPVPGAAPNERGIVKIKFSFSLPGDMALEQKVNKAESLQKKLEESFPGYKVVIDQQFGSVNREGRFTGDLSGQQRVGAANEEARFSLEGPLL